MNYSLGTWVKGKYGKRTWSSRHDIFLQRQLGLLHRNAYFDRFRYALGNRLVELN